MKYAAWRTTLSPCPIKVQAAFRPSFPFWKLEKTFMRPCPANRVVHDTGTGFFANDSVSGKSDNLLEKVACGAVNLLAAFRWRPPIHRRNRQEQESRPHGQRFPEFLQPP